MTGAGPARASPLLPLASLGPVLSSGATLGPGGDPPEPGWEPGVQTPPGSQRKPSPTCSPPTGHRGPRSHVAGSGANVLFLLQDPARNPAWRLGGTSASPAGTAALPAPVFRLRERKPCPAGVSAVLGICSWSDWTDGSPGLQTGGLNKGTTRSGADDHARGEVTGRALPRAPGRPLPVPGAPAPQACGRVTLGLRPRHPGLCLRVTLVSASVVTWRLLCFS